MKQLSLAVLVFCLWALNAQAAQNPRDVLIKFSNSEAAERFAANALSGGARVESLGLANWMHVTFTARQMRSTSQRELIRDLVARTDVLAAQPNYDVHLLEDYRVTDPATRARLRKAIAAERRNATVPVMAHPDNPEFPKSRVGGSGPDPEFSHQWGMIDIGIQNAWANGRGKGVVVAVIDTGVDYTHEDLIDNLFINPGESGMDSAGKDKSSNGIDDDGNGFIDDVMGWDFASDDNKPYDLAVDPIEILMGGGNPGHGTHCAGNVAAVSGNGKGVAGVAPDAKILPIRFLNEKGHGDIAGAVKSINYAVKMGAKVLSNSWGSEGEDAADGAKNQALKDAITAARDAGVLFVGAAGNGHQGTGYDNDTDAKPSIPASYPFENIVSVAAVSKTDALGAFSNWGARTVHLAAPGVEVFSTTVGSHYSDVVVDMYGIRATWDGTSMACPHVAGAAAAYWSKHPSASYMDVKNALINTVKPLPALQGKTVSGGKLNVEKLLGQ